MIGRGFGKRTRFNPAWVSKQHIHSNEAISEWLWFTG